MSKFFSWIADFFANLFNGLIDWFIGLLNNFFGGVGDYIATWLINQGITIELPANVFDVLNEITLSVGYILPITSLMPIVIFWLGFYVVKIIFAVYSLIANTIIKRVTVKT